jgi:hypothetical protein
MLLIILGSSSTNENPPLVSQNHFFSSRRILPFGQHMSRESRGMGGWGEGEGERNSRWHGEHAADAKGARS